mmetsp:Transcript_42484/g.128925  ORF Transcript_42484/g.128925 Transcript_42484/m.128925 type:complete len:255 (-) Transcript_42484:301-1065(-)
MRLPRFSHHNIHLGLLFGLLLVGKCSALAEDHGKVEPGAVTVHEPSATAMIGDVEPHREMAQQKGARTQSIRKKRRVKKMRKMKKMKKMKKSASVRFAEVGEGQKLTGEKAAKVPKAKKGKNGGDDSGGLGTRVAGTSSRIENRGFNEGGKASFKWDKDATGDCDWRADVTACANVGGQVALTRDALELYECESDSDCEDNCCFGGGTVFGWNAITQAEQRACFSVNAMAGASTGCMQYNSVSQIPTDDSNSLK